MKRSIHSGLNIVLAAAMFFNYAGFGYAADLPQGAVVVAGTVSFNSPNVNTMDITASDKAIINYNEFNIGAQKTVNFIQPSASAVALNRVIGSNASSIYGALNANGRIFLINPNGVLFAPGSHVNVGGLVASSMDIANADFLAGKYKFDRNGANGAVTNNGTIVIANGGYVALLAPEVRNTGSVVADLGRVALASGDAATVNLDDNGDFSVVVDPGQVTGISNSGTIKADGGKIILTAKSLNAIFDNAINNTGLIQATTLSSKNGEIYLTANGTVNAGATVVQPGINTIIGGAVTITGKDVKVGNIKTNGGNVKITATDGDVEHAYMSAVTTQGGIFQGNAARDYILDNGSSIDTASGKVDILAGRDLYLGKAASGTIYVYNWKYLSDTREYKFLGFGFYDQNGVFYPLSQGADVGKDGVSPTSGSGYTLLDPANLKLYGTFNNLGETTPSIVTFYEDPTLNPDGKSHVKITGDVYGFEDKIIGSDWDFDDSVIRITDSAVTVPNGATINSTSDVFLTAKDGGIHQNGGIVNAHVVELWSNTGVNGIGANGGLLMATKYLSAYNKTSGDILVENKGDLIIYDKRGHVGFNPGGLEGMSTSTTKVTGTNGVYNKAVGGKIDILTNKSLSVTAPITGHGDIVLKAGTAISQAAAGAITIAQTDDALLNAPTNVHATDSHNTGVWQSGISNDNTVDVAWELPSSITSKYDYTATAGTSYTMAAGSSVKTNGGDATVTANNDVTVTLIDAGTGNVNVTSTTGSITSTHAGADLIGRTISMSAPLGSTATVDIGAPAIGFSFTWDLLAAGTPDALADTGYSTTYTGGKWVYAMTSPVLPDSVSNYFHIVTTNGVATSSVVNLGPFYIDVTAPVITAGTPTGTTGENGWWVSDVTVPFSATDNLSGFAPSGATTESLGSETTSGEGSGLMTGTSSGACDRAGNCASGIQAGPFNVDKTAPTVNATILTNGGTPDGTNGWFKTPGGVDSNSTATDATSKVNNATYEYSLDGVSWFAYTTPAALNVAAQGTSKVTFRVKDYAGNIGSNFVTFKLDNVAPVITFGSETGTKNTDGTWKPDVTVSFNAADNLSGLVPTGILNWPGFSTKTTSGTGSVTVTSDGIFDMAGNYGTPLSLTYTVTNPTPTPTLTPTGALLNEKFLYPHVERLSQKQVNPMDMITSAGLLITGQPFFYHPLTPVDDGAYNGFQLEEGAYDFIDGQLSPCDPNGTGANACKSGM